MLIMPSLTLIAWKLRSNWTLFYPICGMFCCLKVRWENLVTFCVERLLWHKVSILSVECFLTPGGFGDVDALKYYAYELPHGAIIYADKAYNDYDIEDLLHSTFR